ncbi:unnamed protein product [Notodromas monacha]|uniref:Uncharacterized protein n=1 Tax=Notodromas monacha TaxID=399045 RepID=A0A7R9BYN6_9CRUS|nr:unnamed protein product [Notodromas monacha]CAG0922864.1 unnamed protein product [Notodromas monacha]
MDTLEKGKNPASSGRTISLVSSCARRKISMRRKACYYHLSAGKFMDWVRCWPEVMLFDSFSVIFLKLSFFCYDRRTDFGVDANRSLLQTKDSPERFLKSHFGRQTLTITFINRRTK